jgi:hypothetical protein
VKIRVFEAIAEELVTAAVVRVNMGQFRILAIDPAMLSSEDWDSSGS